MKRALLPSVCFAVLSTVAFEETVLATQNKAVESENSYITTVKYVNIEEGFLNLRQQASTTANVIATLIKGTEVIVYTENNGWSKVKVNGKEGYVSTRYLSEHTKEKTIVNASKKITKFVSVSSGKLNMRSEASTSASVLTSLTKGTAVEVISETNGWSKVKVLGKEGYVSTKYLTATQEKSSVSAVAKPTTTSSTSRTTKYVSVTNGTLNMRSGATTSAPVLTSLSKGTAVEVISESNGWSKVKASGKEGYVSTKYLTNSLTHNNHSDAKPATSTSSTQTTKYVSVTNGSLNMRSGATTSAPVLTSLSKGTAVEVISESNGWSKVKASGKEGYVSTKYLTNSLTHNNHSDAKPATSTSSTQTTKYVSVTNGSLNMRSGATTSAPVLTSLSKGTAVEVISESNGWSKVKASGKEGYVSSKYLSDKGQTSSNTISTPAIVPRTTKYVSVTSGSLNMRVGASTGTTILTSLKSGTAVEVISETNGWSKIQVSGKEGYVSSKYLTAGVQSTTPSTNVPKPVTKYVSVTSGTLNVRTKPTTTASIMIKLAKDKEVKVLSDANGWSKVEVFGQVGYVSSQYLSNNKSSNLAPKPAESNKTETKYVLVSGNSVLNVRKAASTNSTILTKLPKNTQVLVMNDANGWAKIKVNQIVGYVSTQFLTSEGPSEKPVEPVQENKKEQMFVDVSLGSTLNMRNNASVASSIIVKLPRGLEVTVYSVKDGWASIEAYGKKGFVSTEFLSKSKPGSEIKVPEPTPELPESNEQPNVKDPITDTDKVNRKYVNVMHGSTLNMRESASTSASILTKLARGTIVTIISEENNWAKVSANGKTGFVSSQYLIATEPFNPGTSIADTEKIEEQFDITLDKLTEIQMAVKPQTDKKYNTYIREDALTLTSATTGTVKGNGWNVRGGAGTNHWVVGSVSKGQSLQIISKVTGADGYTWYQVNYNKSWVNASPEDVKYYLQPSNFLNTTVDSLQFLKLSLPANLNSEEVNTRILAGKGILDGKANAFIQAGDKYKVNEIYLISHALLETGNGTSTLAKGVVVNGRTVYNMYGIGAYDGSAVSSGAQYAYNAGWFTPEEAIIGGAKFIAQGYINSGQDTLYKMRWNPKSAVENGRASHQYATDIGWAAKQVKQIYNLYSLLDAYKLVLDIPKYK